MAAKTVRKRVLTLRLDNDLYEALKRDAVGHGNQTLSTHAYRVLCKAVSKGGLDPIVGDRMTYDPKTITVKWLGVTKRGKTVLLCRNLSVPMLYSIFNQAMAAVVDHRRHIDSIPYGKRREFFKKALRETPVSIDVGER